MTEKLYGNRWKKVGALGEGGQGQIFKVEDITDENKVFVLKKLKNITRIERFKGEIEAIKKLEHLNIVNLVDFNLEASKPYLVTEFYAGGELTFEKVSKFSTIEKLILFSNICKAVGYAHEKGIVHRDIKPANILLKEDNKTPVIADFGVCFNTEEGLERLTETMEQVGARFYMAPELRDGRADDDKVNAQSDVYSLGKLLYWMFRGKVMDRENFDDREWDLRKADTFDHSLYFIQEIFENTIVKNPKRDVWSKTGGRFTDANELAKAIDNVIYILKKDGKYLDINIPQKCVFCNIGKYKIYAVPTTYQTNYMTGLSGSFPDYPNPHTENSSSFCLVCENCGNIQFFNKSMTKGTSWKMNNKDKFRNY